MSDILRIPYEKQQFPDSAQEMLRIVDKVVRKWKTYNTTRLFARDLQTALDRYLFCLMETKGVFSTKLSAIQELQLIDMLCTFFEDRKSSHSVRSASDGTPTAFDLIFCGQEADAALHEARCAILARTVCLAVQLRCGSLLNDTATWMQRVCPAPSTSRSSSSILIPPGIKMVCCRLIDDYASSDFLSTDPNTSVHQHRRLQQQRLLLDLASSAPGLLPYIAASAMSTYDWFTRPPLSLLEILTEWICSHPKLLLKPFKDVAAKTTTGPAPPFLRALSQSFGKLLALCVASAADETNSMAAFYGRLQLGLLHLMETLPKFANFPIGLATLETPCSILTPRVITDMLTMIRQQQHQNIQNVCYTLFRVLQVAVATRCYSGSKRDLELAISQYLADYPFLEFVLSQPF